MLPRYDGALGNVAESCACEAARATVAAPGVPPTPSGASVSSTGTLGEAGFGITPHLQALPKVSNESVLMDARRSRLWHYPSFTSSAQGVQ